MCAYSSQALCPNMCKHTVTEIKRLYVKIKDNADSEAKNNIKLGTRQYMMIVPNGKSLFISAQQSTSQITDA